MIMTQDALVRLADEVLTFIEQREAEQVAYGVYDVTLTGREVIDGFQPIDGSPFPDADRASSIGQALRHLSDEVQIIRFDTEPEPAEWVFRSRVCEIVRLLTRLRQRIVRVDADKPRHRISKSKRLVEDVKFHVAARRVPRRDVAARTCLAPLLNDAEERRVAAEILLEVIERELPKLRSMSGFQRRSLEAILRAIEIDAPLGTERGVVVTASTGAGKTYAFFLPVLVKMIIERSLRGREGVKAICIYPRVALSENQLTDFVEVLYYLNRVLKERGLPPITIGIESGAAVYDSKDLKGASEDQQRRLRSQRGWRYDKDASGYLAPFAYCVGTAGQACADEPQRLVVRLAQTDRLVCPTCNKEYPFIRFARDVMRAHPPDVLIATTESLNRRLLSSEFQYLFGTAQFSAPSVVMLDEIHLQTSTAGTQVALLLRRLLARIRLGKQDRGDSTNLAFVGLSATIAHAIQFVSELTGLPAPRIIEVKPQDDEMQVVGAERFIFVRAEDTEDTAVISTLIQTAMCVLHNMPQPPSASDLKTYRTFGFVQSLDIVGRWMYQMEDAEKVQEDQKQRRAQYKGRALARRPIKDIPLYVYRYPPFNRQLFPSFFGPETPASCGCESRPGPDLTCPFFQAGECWWALSRQDKALQRPMNIKRKSGSDRGTAIEAGDDLIITTSALEVGYDDEALMCVIQYTAPTNVASFVQRKGRGGRKVGTRPIVVTVLSPYKSTDLFLFRNEHLLTDPTFRKLPLNAQNRYLQRIHGFYALIDWLAYRASLAGVKVDFDSLEADGLAFLMREGAEESALQNFKDHLSRAFEADLTTLARVLTGRPDGLLWAIFAEGLVKLAHPILGRDGQRYVRPRDLLRAHLPENLFSDINLPEVQVDYRPDDQWQGKRLDSESISLALGSTIPGNVTFRGGRGATWVPPIGGDERLVPLSRYYDLEERPELIDTVRLPLRALRRVHIAPQQVRELEMYRPRAIRPLQFSSDHDGSFWWASPETGELREHRRHEDAGQDVTQLAHSSSAYPVSAVDIGYERDTPTSAYTIEPGHPSLSADPVGRALVRRIALHSDEPANMNMLKVRRIILGSQYSLKFHESRADEIADVVGFRREEDSGGPCAIGYQMRTEGLALDLDLRSLETLSLPEIVQAQIARNATRHAFVTALTIEYGANYFAAENLSDALLTLVDHWLHAEGGTAADLPNWFSHSMQDFNRRLITAVEDTLELSPKKREAVYHLAEDDALLSRFLQIYAESRPGRRLYRQYLRDTFQYSVTQALKQTSQEAAGVEALNYVAAWTELQLDFDQPDQASGRAADRLWIYEIGMGGIGVMRATHDMLLSAPDRFWTMLTHKMTRCPTSQEEALLRHLLAQPVEWLEECERLVEGIGTARGTGDRQRAIEALLATVRRRLGVPIRQEQVRSLLRVFIPEYAQVVDGQPLVSWRLYREINAELLPGAVEALGREPTFPEARSMFYHAVADGGAEGEVRYPELRRLLQLYREEYGPEPQASSARASFEREVRQAFENGVERRLLLTCRGACPTCLDDRSGEIEAPGMARLLLSRAVLSRWVDSARSGQTIRLQQTGEVTGVRDELRWVFESGARAAYLRVPGDALTSLCAAISYLTDAGVHTSLGLVYPMITDVQTVYPDDLRERPAVEITVRPIE